MTVIQKLIVLGFCIAYSVWEKTSKLCLVYTFFRDLVVSWLIFKFYFFIFDYNTCVAPFNFFKIKNCLILSLSTTKVSYIKTLYIILFFDISQISMKSLYKDNENLKNQSNLNLFANNIIGLQPIIK